MLIRHSVLKEVVGFWAKGSPGGGALSSEEYGYEFKFVPLGNCYINGYIDRGTYNYIINLTRPANQAGLSF